MHKGGTIAPEHARHYGHKFQLAHGQHSTADVFDSEAEPANLADHGNTRVVRGFDRLRRPEETSTLLVKAHGALLLLSTEVTTEQRLTPADIGTEQKRECREVMIGFRTSNMNEVGVELLDPFDGFWQALNPPRDGRSSGKRGSKMLLRAEQSCKASPFVWGTCRGHSLAQKKSNHPFGPGSVGRP
jgi:hypothetical protein